MKLDLLDREFRLTFCTNVLPDTEPDAIVRRLQEVAPASASASLGFGLWLSASTAHALQQGTAAADFHARLAAAGYHVFTLNGFPYGDFHQDVVKEAVFRPTWAEPERLAYTLALGELLAGWMPAGETGSISTLAGGYKRLDTKASFSPRCGGALVKLALAWREVEDRTGVRLVLGLEPEPRCTLETTSEVVDFFETHVLGPAGRMVGQASGVSGTQLEELVRRHVGVCYDACHQAVEFEEPVAALDRLKRHGICLAKLQITNALEVRQPYLSDTRERLQAFAEPRYLHQVSRQTEHGVDLCDDLSVVLAHDDPDWWDADLWRIHFHVPVHRDEVSQFHTTRDDLVACMRKVLHDDLTRHLEVETYTWGVLPGEAEDLAAGLAAEMEWTERTLTDLANEPSD